MSLHPPTARSLLVSEGLLASKARSFLDSYGRARIFEVLSQGIHKGSLSIQDEDGTFEFVGKADTSPLSVTLKVCRARMWSRIMISHDMGVAEAYMDGDFEVSSLKDLLNLWLDNRKTLSGLSNVISSLFASISAFAITTLWRQTLSMARANVEVAYDTSNNFFRSFLSKEMMYSCAIWSEAEGGVRGDLTAGSKPGDLEAAQRRKIHSILKKARLRAGDRLLEIGSGWGAMAVEAALLGCTVDTITLSREQMHMARQRADEAGVGDKVCVHLCDYRKLPLSFEHAFDAVISCEMIEAVGSGHLGEFFRILDWALKVDRASIVITATAQPENRWSDYQPDDFARHYHWPNTHLPSALSLPNALQAAIPGKFVLHHLEDHGIHYPRTLREWARRFEANFNGEVVEELREKYPQLRTEEGLQAFKRKWLYMFVYAEVGYARAYTSLNCWTFARPENISEICS